MLEGPGRARLTGQTSQLNSQPSAPCSAPGVPQGLGTLKGARVPSILYKYYVTVRRRSLVYGAWLA